MKRSPPLVLIAMTTALPGIILIMVLTGQLGIPSLVQAQPQTSLAGKNVLILHAHEASGPIFVRTDKGLSDTLHSGGISSVNQFYESLDLRRNPAPGHRKLLVEQMRMRYSHRKLDMIITMYPEALEFVQKDCRDFLPDVPILALYLASGIELPKTGRRIIRHFTSIDIGSTLNIALKLVPGARRVYVVSGAHELDRKYEDEARRIFKKWEGRLEFLYLSHMAFDDILATTSRTPPGSIILTLAFTQDVTGKNTNIPDVVEQLSRSSTAPIFGVADSGLGHGITGGSLINFEHIGRKGGQLALDILGGAETPDNIPAVLDVSPVPMFDWRQIRRWNLREAALPEGSIIVNKKEITLWEVRYYLLGGSAFFLVETSLIFFLLVQRRQRRRSQELLRNAEEKYRGIFEGAVEGIFETSPEGSPLTANPALAKMLGYDSPSDFTSAIRDSAFQVFADPGKRAEYVGLLEKQGVLLGFECEMLRRDGTKFWGSISGRRVCGPDGKTLYYSGFMEDITKHKRMEDTLRESEERYRVAERLQEMGHFEWDVKRNLITASPSLQSLHGLKPGTFQGGFESWFQLIHPEDRSRVDEFVRDSFRRELVEEEFEFRIVRTDGEVRFLLGRARASYDADKKPAYVFGAMIDITERKRVEEVLRESEKEAKRIAREASAMAEIGRIIGSTLTIEDVYGPFAAEVKKIIPFDRIVISMIDGEKGTVRNVYISGREVHDREVEKVYPLEGSGNAEMLRTKSPFLLQTEDFTHYQDRFPMLLSTFQAGFRSILNVPLVSQGKVIGGLLFRSLTPYAYTDESVRLAEMIGNQIAEAIANAQLFLKQKQTDEALRKSEERFRQVAENVGDFIWEVDANGLYRYTSPSVERILGYSPDELIGKKHFYDLFAPAVREELKAAAFRVFGAKQSFRAFPNPNLSREGKIVHLETSGVPVLDSAGNLDGYRGADTDVSERKRAEEELSRHQEHLEEMIQERTVELAKAMRQAEAANQAKSAFLANMSHELRTPLTSILGIIQILERDPEFPREQGNFLGILGGAGRHLFELIDDVLELSKIDAGKAGVVIEPFDLPLLLEDLASIMIPRAEKKGLQTVMELDRRLPRYIRSDAPKLRHILINLISNAIKFTEKGQITLRAGRREDGDAIPGGEAVSPVRLEFEVEDTGIGISPEDQGRIFDSFVQVNPSRKPSGGVGLGLAISQKLAALLGGGITVRSEVGRGSVFGLRIEVERAEDAAIRQGAISRQVTGLAPGQPSCCLLVVDDNLESRVLLRQVLEPVGFQVLEAAGGREAVDLFQREQPHLVWMDIRMPEMDGYEAARRIREAERERREEDGREIHTPIIAFTAGVMENIETSPLAGVFDDWVYKPFREEEIFAKIERHLGVQFVYQPAGFPAVQADACKDRDALTSAEISKLPTQWVVEFYKMLKRGRSRELLTLIGEIQQENSDLARALAKLVRVHQWDQLISLTQGALPENGNG